MTDNKSKENGDKDETLKVKERPKLSLTQTVESGHVQQTLHGRQKTVTVEVRRTRTFSSSPDKKPAETVTGDRKLTASEQEARKSALENAAKAPKEEITAKKPRRPEAVHDESKESPAKEEAGKKDRKHEKEFGKKSFDDDSGSGEKLVLTGTARKKGLEREESYQKSSRAKGEPKRRQGKMTVTQALEQNERHRSLASIKRQRDKAKRLTEIESSETEKIVREVVVPEVIEVQELANRMAIRSVDVIKELMKLGSIIKPHDTIDADTAELIVAEFGHKIKRVTEADVEKSIIDEEDSEENLKPRPPVVTIMGHVDHGKTSLLDAIRTTDVAAKEEGGITQHIGAYQITTNKGEKITFLDTPGHEAFTAMRARGAQATDIVVLVVAADDSIMPQTIEAINHAKAAEVPIIVAINKIDKPNANVQKVKNDLLSYELIPEDLGGETMVVEVSAKQKINLDKLEETILLQSEVLELKANPDTKAAGVVIESRLEIGRGVVATLLVQKGTLKPGDIVIAGTGYGKIRALIDDKGENIKEATPSVPVEILGLSETPNAGDIFAVVGTDKQARDIVAFRQKHKRDKAAAELNKVSMESLFKAAGSEATKNLPVIIKADVQGSAEAIIGSLDKISTDEVKAKVVHSAIGGITESDVTLAQTVGAHIIGFNVRANSTARDLAKKERVDIRYYSIIYNVLDDVRDMLSGMLKPTVREEYLGKAEILDVFKITKVGKVAGCIVREGSVKKGAGVRLIRDDVVIHEGKLKTLKRFKDETNEVKEGTECGMAFENYEDIKKGDMIEAFEVITEQRKLDK